jgi:hypothetical protein
MERRRRWTPWIAALAIAVSAGTTVASAQSQTGNVYGSVADDKGQALPGVTLTLSGAGAPQTQVSDAQGQFRFPSLPPSTYKLEGALEGFSSVVVETVVVNLNRNTTINVTLQPAIEETITVTAESPLLDARKVQTGATVDKTELEKIPSARDPWVILQTTPGVLVDRVNVGGNESGQQSSYVGNGDDGRNSVWAVDGVEITDVSAIGSSSSYYDFDAFEEMQVSTGGSDAGARTGGVGINLVTKRGTNEWRGSGRYIYDNDSLQSEFSPSASDFAEAGPWNDNNAAGTPIGRSQPSFKQGNRIVKFEDYGAELGGPIVKDRFWFWSSYGKNQIDLLTVSDFQDNTTLKTWNLKLNGQVAASNSATLFVSDNDKVKIGRNASPTRPQETTWDQAVQKSDPKVFKMFNERPTIAKLEDTHVFGATFFLTGMYSESEGGFSLTPEGGVGASHPNAALEVTTLSWHNTFVSGGSFRPQDQAKLEGSYFFSTGAINHELKFGANYRQATVRSLSRWPGSGIDYTNGGVGYLTGLYSDGVLNYEVKYKSLFLQDTLTTGNLTANAGLRYDVQSGRQLAGVSAANAARPDIVPELRFAGGSPGFGDWADLQPRLGLTYALGEEKKTLLRASYSRFADQISGGPVTQTYPLYPQTYAYFYFYDTNGNGHADPNELAPGALGPKVGEGPNYNPLNPAQYLRSNTVDPDLRAPTTDELVLGIEHSVMPELVVGLNLTYRKIHDLLALDDLVFDGNPKSAANVGSSGRRAVASDYVVTSVESVVLPNGSTREIPVYSLRPGLQSRGGTFLYNGGPSQEYRAVALTFNKRLSHQWMMRGNFSWNDWTWNVPSGSIANPQEFFTNPFGYSGGSRDGDQVVFCEGNKSGAKADVCPSSQWSYSWNGLYQVAPDRGWGFNVSAAINGHQGYPNAYHVQARRQGFNNTSKALVMAARRPDEFRNDDVHVLDLRLEKEFRFDRFGVTVGVDCFNALNSGTVLQRQTQLSYPTDVNQNDLSTSGDFVREVVSPRIFRLGARFSFN